jgi:hypothetical protein
MEIALFNRSFFYADLSTEHRRQSIVDAAFDLRPDTVRIHRQTAVDGTHHPMHSEHTAFLN